MFFGMLLAVHGFSAIFVGCKPLKMGAIRKSRFSNGDVEKAMDGFFNNVLALEDQVTLLDQVVEPLIENYVAVPSGIEFRSVHSHQTPECCMSTLAGKPH